GAGRGFRVRASQSRSPFAPPAARNLPSGLAASTGRIRLSGVRGSAAGTETRPGSEPPNEGALRQTVMSPSELEETRRPSRSKAIVRVVVGPDAAAEKRTWRAASQTDTLPSSRAAAILEPSALTARSRTDRPVFSGAPTCFRVRTSQ